MKMAEEMWVFAENCNLDYIYVEFKEKAVCVMCKEIFSVIPNYDDFSRTFFGVINYNIENSAHGLAVTFDQANRVSRKYSNVNFARNKFQEPETHLSMENL